ncbi:hypothetical protein PX701_12550 [Agromyces sp. H3Y2-19a]|uniref:hypothetical protein n=1 Tax=Agromyces TaxID=33877 RepID=UPI001E5CB9F1|nr:MULTISPECIES: hypothetical protein [Agromyces]MCD5347952.1 hypothetical protein [Agromyces sp. S2-1-8]MDF0514455.1 hypothetical protein [Agromyces chromiiresistens]
MITLRPRRTLGWSYGVAAAALVLPLLAVELWVLDPTGSWPIVAATAAIVGGLMCLAWIAYRRTRVSISRYGIVERGFFGTTTVVAARDVSKVLRLDLYRSNSLDTTDELFVVCRSGRGRFRMRGRFWDASAMDLVAGVLDVEESTRDEPVTLAELRESDPGLLYWFERRSLMA